MPDAMQRFRRRGARVDARQWSAEGEKRKERRGGRGGGGYLACRWFLLKTDNGRTGAVRRLKYCPQSAVTALKIGCVGRHDSYISSYSWWLVVSHSFSILVDIYFPTETASRGKHGERTC